MRTLVLLTCFMLMASMQATNANGKLSEIRPLVIYMSPPEESSFLQLVDNGLSKAQTKLQIPVSRLVIDNNDYLNGINSAVAQGYDPILLVYAAGMQGLKQFVTQNPGTRFILYDVSYDIANSIGLIFDHSHAAYTIGYLAGVKTKSDKVGFIGGLNSRPVNNFKCGFELGLQQANPDASFYVKYIGEDSKAWTNTAQARKLAIEMYNQGIDIIFPVAGAANEAIYQVAMEKRINTFGIDMNQNSRYSEVTLASMVKHVDKATYAVLKQLYLGIWNSNHKHFGSAQNMINVLLNEQHLETNNDDKAMIKRLSKEMKLPISKPIKLLNTRCDRHL